MTRSPIRGAEGKRLAWSRERADGRARAVLAGVAIVVGSLALIGAALTAYLAASAPRSEQIVTHLPAPRSFVVTYTNAAGEKVRREIPLEEALCTFGPRVAMMSARSTEGDRALWVLGDQSRVTDFTLRFDDRIFIATEESSMYGEYFAVTRLRGDIHELSGRLPGDLVVADAAVSGSIACERVRR